MVTFNCFFTVFCPIDATFCDDAWRKSSRLVMSTSAFSFEMCIRDRLGADHAGKHWRCEMLPDTCVNDPMLFGYPGFSLFSSPFPKSCLLYTSHHSFSSFVVKYCQETGCSFLGMVALASISTVSSLITLQALLIY